MDKKPKKILGDHTRVGKKFIPPMAQLGFTGINWADTLLPELLWIGLLNHRFGLGEGAEIALALSRTMAGIVKNEFLKDRWPIACSSFSTPTAEDRAKLLAELDSKGCLTKLRAALAVFPLYYPECPLNFIFDGAAPTADKTKALTDLKDALDSLFNRWEKAATLVQANAVYIAFVSGKFKVFKGSALGDFPEIANFPDTEKSQHIAGFVRTSVSVFFTPDSYRAHPWPVYFWNRGLEIEPCKLPE
jgi:hypothetical protein